MTCKVFVTQFFTRGDFRKAEAWGEVVFITDLEHRPEPTSPTTNDEVIAKIALAMSEYVPGTDFLLLAPSQVINLIVGSMLEPGEHKVLKWDNRSMTYRLHMVYL
jgi:hypothetical protein